MAPSRGYIFCRRAPARPSSSSPASLMPNSDGGNYGRRKSGSAAAARDGWKPLLLLAYQSLGVVYGELGISPLYVFRRTFAEDISHTRSNVEVFGVLSFVFWTLTLIPLLKYVFIVLRADDNGEGGTFALYSLICRHANVSLLPNKQASDRELSTFSSEHHPEVEHVCRFKTTLERHSFLHTMLLMIVMLGTGMVIGDGVLIPAISVFSAVEGLSLSKSVRSPEHYKVPITCFIIIGLFVLQHYGTRRVGYLFAPIILTWLLCITALGVYNIVTWNTEIYRAISPYYMYLFLKKTKSSGWKSLGGILLCVTGCEAMFGDLGHFSYTAIQVAFTGLVYPALIFVYMGQAAYLSRHHHIPMDHISFYNFVPECVQWPFLVLAILSAGAGSQSIISSTFSIISQSQSLGCFPRVKVVHTSEKIHGQIYIPEINWIMMVLCVTAAVVLGDASKLGTASGLVVVAVMMVTTCLTSLVMMLCWRRSVFISAAFLVFFGFFEGLYFSASLVNFLQGGWFPILLALIIMSIMSVWHYATIKKHEVDLHNKVSLDWLLALELNLGVARVPGIGLVFSDLVSGIPANFSRFVTNLPAFHRVLVFVCIKYVTVPFVPTAERYLVGRVGPPGHQSYRCIVRYGYRDVHQDVDSFETQLILSLAEFIRLEAAEQQKLAADGSCSGSGVEILGAGDEGGSMMLTVQASSSSSSSTEAGEATTSTAKKKVRFAIMEEGGREEGGGGGEAEESPWVREELAALDDARESGTAFMLGRSHVRAKSGSSLLKKIVIDVAYNFLQRNCRGPDVALRVPPSSLLEVGVVYVL